MAGVRLTGPKVLGFYGQPTSRFVEAVAFERAYYYDAWRIIVTRLLWAVALLVTLVLIPGAAWWTFVIVGCGVVNCVLELLTWSTIAAATPGRNWLTYWLSRTTFNSWSRAAAWNITGIVGLLVMVGLGWPVSFFGLPRDISQGHLIVFWVFTILYSLWCARAMAHANTVGADRLPRRKIRWERGLHWFLWPFHCALGLTIVFIWWVTKRYDVIAVAWPALVITALAPMAYRSEIGMLDRAMAAATSVHDEEMADLRASVAEQAVTIAAPLTANATRALLNPTRFDATDAGLAVANIPALIMTVGHDGGVMNDHAVVEAVRASAAWWTGPMAVEADACGITVWELDTCLRLVRRVARAIVEARADLGGELAIRLAVEPDPTKADRSRIVLSFMLPQGISEEVGGMIHRDMAIACDNLGVEMRSFRVAGSSHAGSSASLTQDDGKARAMMGQSVTVGMDMFLPMPRRAR